MSNHQRNHRGHRKPTPPPRRRKKKPPHTIHFFVCITQGILLWSLLTVTWVLLQFDINLELFTFVFTIVTSLMSLGVYRLIFRWRIVFRIAEFSGFDLISVITQAATVVVAFYFLNRILSWTI